MTTIKRGEAWELFVVIDKDTGKPISIVAKDPNRPSVTDITQELAELFSALSATESQAK